MAAAPFAAAEVGDAAGARWQLQLCVNGRCETALPRHGADKVVLRSGQSIRGVLTDGWCTARKARSAPCAMSSFTVQLQGPARLAPRVRAQNDQAGTYTFVAYLLDAGTYTLDLRHDFDDGQGYCECSLVNGTSAPIFQHLLGIPGISVVVLPVQSNGRVPASSLSSGRWLEVNCSSLLNTDTPAQESSYAREACGAKGASQLLLSNRRWLYTPFATTRRRYKVFPLDFIGARGGDFWLHVEGDSTLLRGEKEDLMLLLANGSIEHVRNKTVHCLHPLSNHHSIRTEACGNLRLLGISKHSMSFVNLYEWWLPQGRLIVSFATAWGISNRLSGYAKCYASERHGVWLDERRVARPCNGTPAGALYWARLQAQVGALFGAKTGTKTGAKALDAVVLNFNLHVADAPDLCTNATREYVRHWRFGLASLQDSFSGPLLFHTGLLTQFSDTPVSGAVTRVPRTPDAPFGFKLQRSWSCRSADRLSHLVEAAWEVAKDAGAVLLDALGISAPWPEATADNRHYEGGRSNARKQGVTIAIVNEMFNVLSMIGRGRGTHRTNHTKGMMQHGEQSNQQLNARVGGQKGGQQGARHEARLEARSTGRPGAQPGARQVARKGAQQVLQQGTQQGAQQGIQRGIQGTQQGAPQGAQQGTLPGTQQGALQEALQGAQQEAEQGLQQRAQQEAHQVSQQVSQWVSQQKAPQGGRPGARPNAHPGVRQHSIDALALDLSARDATLPSQRAAHLQRRYGRNSSYVALLV